MYACSCSERRKPINLREEWYLMEFRIDWNRGKTTQWGIVRCLNCNAEWKTTAKYVLRLARGVLR